MSDVIQGDARHLPLRNGSGNCVVTAAPYWGLRDDVLPPLVWGGDACEHEWGETLPARAGRGNNHGEYSTSSLTNPDRQDTLPRAKDAGAFCLRCSAWRGSLGLEPTPGLYVEHLVQCFREVRRVLRDDGTLWLNLGDSYCNQGGQRTYGSYDGGTGRAAAPGARPMVPPGLKPKDLIGISWRVAFALQADGWYLRSDIIWGKPNPMPESVQGSHYSRHRVTIAEYERLSGLRYVDECVGDAWAGDMPSLSEREVFSRQAPVSANREGDCHSAGARGTRGRARETARLQPIKIRTAEQGQIRSDREGQADPHQGARQIQGDPEGAADLRATAPAHEGPPDQAKPAAQGEQRLV